MQRELVEQARDGDRAAFTELVAGSIAGLFNVAQLMLRDPVLADDVVQETLVLAWRDLRGLRDADAFEGWLHRILVRSVYREAHRERRRAVSVLVQGPPETLPDATAAVADRDAVDRAMRRLRPEQRAVLVVHHFLGMSDRQAALALGVPPGTVRSRLNRAMSALRAELEADARGATLVMESTR